MNNVADIWLKGRYVEKNPKPFRPGNITCILKENMSGQGTHCLEEPCPNIKFGSPLRLSPYYMMSFKPAPPQLFVHSSLIDKKIMARHYVYFLPTPSSLKQNSLPDYSLAHRPN